MDNATNNKTVKPVKIGDHVRVKVKSGFYGTLYYRNPRSGELFVWRSMGEVLLLEMSDLISMKATTPAYFQNHWIIITGVADTSDCKATAADIYNVLAVSHYYKDFIDPTKFDEVCTWSDKEIEERVGMLSSGAKENLIVALNEFVGNGTLDSRKKIKAFEKALGCELISK